MWKVKLKDIQIYLEHSQITLWLTVKTIMVHKLCKPRPSISPPQTITYYGISKTVCPSIGQWLVVSNFISQTRKVPRRQSIWKLRDSSYGQKFRDILIDKFNEREEELQTCNIERNWSTLCIITHTKYNSSTIMAIRVKANYTEQN